MIDPGPGFRATCAVVMGLGCRRVKHSSRLAIVCIIAFSRTCLAADSSGNAVTVNAVGAVTFPDAPVKFAMLELRRQALPHLSLAAAAAYLKSGGSYEEAQLRLSAILAFQGSAWTVENRHLLALGEESERYRCRLRFIRSFRQSGISLRGFDELYLDLDRGFVRNNIALGLGSQLGSAVTAELYHVWVDNHENRSDSYVLALLTVRL